MKKLFLLCACLLALLVNPVRSYASDPDIVLVRIYDISGARIVVTRGEGKSEVVTFPSGTSVDNMKLAGDGYYKVVHGLYKEGYALQSTFSSTGSGVTTLVFVRAPKP